MQYWYFMLEYDLCWITMIICISYDVLMMYCIYIIVIDDCMYVKDIVNIYCVIAIIVYISYVDFMCASVYGDDFN